MRINKTQANYINNQNNKTVSCKGAREFIRTLSNPDALTSTVLLEASVTGGRGYNAYKRGGVNELRERAVDDIVSAVFWMKGVDIFNKLGDKFGEKVLKLPTTDFDMGKDALRTPFKNRVADLQNLGVKPEDIAKTEKKLAAFKFSKIILATLISTAFVGFALPKINQGITRLIAGKSKQKDDSTANTAQMASVSFEEFSNIIEKNNKPSFKGLLSPELMSTVVHYLENNKVCKLLSSDVGIMTGRVTSARNRDEGLEYLFRDSASSFFYVASTPLIYSGLQKVTKGKSLTSIDPVAAKQLHELCVNQLNNNGSMNVKEFAKKVLGVIDGKSQELIKRLPFNDKGIISLNKLLEYIDDTALREKAAELAKLQPQQAGIGAVLTKQQVSDVFKSGAIAKPEFMQKVYKTKFGEALTNPYKYISMKKITSFRSGIDDYAQAIIDTAVKKNNGVVDIKLLNKLNRKSFIMSASFRAIAMGISAFALGFAIPKIQYAITAKRTGSNAAPGFRDLNKNDNGKQEKI